MNKRRQTLHILLAVLIVASAIVMSGHSYVHAPSDVTKCELCIQHGGSGNALAPEIYTVFISPALETFVKSQQPVLPANTDLYQQPSRAPPHLT